MKYTLYKILIILLVLPVLSYAQVNLENRFRLGQNYELTGELEKAKTIYKELLEVQPWNQRYIQALNDIYLQLKDYNASAALFENILSQRQNDINAYGMLGTTYFIMGNRNKAYETWDKALNIATANQSVYRIIANYAIENRAFDKAIDILEKGKELTNNPRLFVFDLANIHTANMKYKDAVNEYCDLLEIEPLQLETVKRRIAAFIERPGAAEAAEEAIIKNLAGHENKILKELLASVFAMEERFDQALELIIEIDQNSNSNGASLFKFAQDMLNNNHYDTALKCYSYLIKNYSSSSLLPSAKIGYAKTLELTTTTDIENSSDEWREYFYIDTSYQTKFNPVISAYEEIAETYPENAISAEALLRIAKIKFKRQLKITEAVEILTYIILNKRSTPHSLESNLLLGDINIYLGKIDDALQNYNNAYKLRDAAYQKEKQILLKIAKVLFWKGEFTRSLSFLSRITNNLNDDNANNALELALIINLNKQDSLNLSKYANALFLAEQKKFKEASDELLELYGNRNLLVLSKLAGFQYANILAAMDKYSEAITVLEEILDNRLEFNADKGLFLCGQIYQFGLKDNESAIDCYRNILENYTNSLYFDKSRELIQTLNNDGKTI